MEDVAKRYFATLAFIGLNSNKYKKLKADMKHYLVKNNTNILQRS